MQYFVSCCTTVTTESIFKIAHAKKTREQFSALQLFISVACAKFSYRSEKSPTPVSQRSDGCFGTFSNHIICRAESNEMILKKLHTK